MGVASHCFLQITMWAEEGQGWERVGFEFGQIWSGIPASLMMGHANLDKLSFLRGLGFSLAREE